jgi:hypothetical protein
LENRRCVEKMGYFVVALGGLLALGGALVVFTSYGIILVERGWAGVIAGTTALASGVVTIALGLILHRLSSFYEFLKIGKAALPWAGGLLEEETREPSSPHAPPNVPKAATAIETAPGSAGVPPASGVRSWPQRQARSFHWPGRIVSKSRGAGAPGAPRTRDPDFASPTPPVFPPSPANGNPANGNEVAPDLSSEPGLGPATPADTAVEGGIGQEMLQVRPFPETPMAAGEVDIQPWPGSGWPAEPAMVETIFPEAGQVTRQSLEEAGIQRAEKPFPEASEQASIEPPRVTFEAGAGAHPAESGSGKEPSSDDAISGDTLAIVGRYESEGASFVRYADGSIEARTDHAVFHFKSMAELKDFMESQAQTPKE